jgi:hypothetical protein
MRTARCQDLAVTGFDLTPEDATRGRIAVASRPVAGSQPTTSCIRRLRRWWEALFVDGVAMAMGHLPLAILTAYTCVARKV